MKRFLIPQLLAAAALALAGFAQAAVTITNGDFEAGGDNANSFQNVTGWFDYASGNGDIQLWEGASPNTPEDTNGSYWLLINDHVNLDPTGVYQQIGTHDAGITAYDVSFTKGRRSDFLFDTILLQLWMGTPTGTPGDGTNPLGVGLTLVDSVEITFPGSGAPPETAFETLTLNANGVGTGESLWLAFASNDDNTTATGQFGLIDDVSIVAIPEPGTFGMLLGGACFMLVLFHRRRHS